MYPTIAIVESKENKELHDWVTKHTSARVVEATPQSMDRLSSEKIDLVLVDVKMASASGIELLEAVMRLIRHSPAKIVLMTVDFEEISKRPSKGSTLASWMNGLLQRSPEHSTPSPTLGYPRGDWHSVTIPEIAQDMGVSRSALAQILGTTERNLARWISGQTKPKGTHEAALQRLGYIHALLTRAFKREVIPRYLKEPNANLGGRTPLMLLLAQDSATVEANLLQLVEGVYT